MTIGDRLDQSRGIAVGFDFMRVTLALAVVAAHSYWVVDFQSDIALRRESWFPIYAILPAFFGLSGFLVASSAERLSLRDFAINRSLRMFPALAVEIFISAFLIGAIFTTLPAGEYISSPGVWHYLTNILGIINYKLPGVFEDLPSKGFVNSSIWTIPWEYGIYIFVAVTILTGAIKKKYPILIITTLYVAGSLTTQLFQLKYDKSLAAGMLYHALDGGGTRLILPALIGFVVYKFRKIIPYNATMMVLAVAWCLAVAMFAPIRWIADPAMSVLASIPLVYLTVAAGVTRMPKLPFFHRGDYSYGIYLYGFPIQQAVKSVMPGIGEPWLLTLIAAPAVTIFAAFSWHYVEKPILKLRKKVSFVAQIRLAPDEQKPAAPADREAAPAGHPARTEPPFAGALRSDSAAG